MSEVAHVTRPTAKGAFLLVGLDESVTGEEVTAAVAKVGECSEESVRIGPIRPMRNGLGIIWVQGTLVSVNRLIAKGRLLIG